MTRDEHIAEAERLLAAVDRPARGPMSRADIAEARAQMMALAQLHTSLAKAKQPLIIVLHPNATADDIAHLKANLAELWRTP